MLIATITNGRSAAPPEQAYTGLPAQSGPFRVRMGSRGDLASCAELLPSGFRADPKIVHRLIHLWGVLLDGGAATLTIVEELQQRHPTGIEGFGLSIFITDRCFEEYCAAPAPYLSALMYQRMLAGENVTMTPRQILMANSTIGINIVVLHFGMRNEDLSEIRTMEMLAMGGAGFYFFHGGYRINAIVQEVYGDQQARLMERGGFRLVRDFQRQSPEGLQNLRPRHYPYLFMLRRDWIEPGAIHSLSQLFSPAAPVLCFAASERRVLEGALLNESDAEIASRLRISLDGVKKAWRNSYDRADRRIPGLISQRISRVASGAKKNAATCFKIFECNWKNCAPGDRSPKRQRVTLPV